MADKYKYKRTSSVKDIFITNFKGNLGEEVLKSRLAQFVNEVDYEERIGGDGKVDFTMAANPEIGIKVKTRYGDLNKVRWNINSYEVAFLHSTFCALSPLSPLSATFDCNLVSAPMRSR